MVVIDSSARSNYNVSMKTKLVQIGNSRGVRIPKALIEQADLKGSIELDLRDGELVIRPARKRRKANPRAGWEEAFAQAIRKNGPIAELSDDERAFLDMPNEFDEKEWTW
jgi:antitoxin MazE